VPWPVKVVARIRRPGQSAAQLLTRLGQAEGELSAGVVAAVLPLEPGATVAWSMRVAAQPNAPEGNNVYETYPKLLLTLPLREGGPDEAAYPALRAARDALLARLTALANTANWTVLQLFSKRYGD